MSWATPERNLKGKQHQTNRLKLVKEDYRPTMTSLEVISKGIQELRMRIGTLVRRDAGIHRPASSRIFQDQTLWSTRRIETYLKSLRILQNKRPKKTSVFRPRLLSNGLHEPILYFLYIDFWWFIVILYSRDLGTLVLWHMMKCISKAGVSTSPHSSQKFSDINQHTHHPRYTANHIAGYFQFLPRWANERTSVLQVMKIRFE